MRFKSIFLLIIIILVINLSGCLVGPNFHRPPPPQVDGYTELPLPPATVPIPCDNIAGNSQLFLWGEDIPAQWWHIFRVPALNDLICRGIANSPTLKAAVATLHQAQENLKAQIGSSLLPAIDAQFSAQRERFTGQAFGLSSSTTSATGGSSSTSNVFSLYTATVEASYVLDVFGGARRQIEALAAQVDYQRFQLEGAYLTLTSNIVTTAITEAQLRAQIAATHEIICTQQKYLNIVTQQLRLGGASGAEVLIQQNQLAVTCALLPPLEKNLAETRHRLAILVGSFPSESCLPIFTLDQFHLPLELPVSLPCSLVCQRPDVRAQAALLHAATAQVGVATANLFPQFNLFPTFMLNGEYYGYESNKLSNLFTPANLIYNYGIQILQPLFHGGSLWAKRRAAIAGCQQAAALYCETVLQAFQNVADALRAIETDARFLRAQKQAEMSARNSLILTEKQFRLGGTNYLFLLTAERSFQQARINLIQAEAQRFSDTAALFQALGGGWWNRCH